MMPLSHARRILVSAAGVLAMTLFFGIRLSSVFAPQQLPMGSIPIGGGGGGGACYTGYSHCAQLTLGSITGTLTDFPVLVDVTLGASRINNASCYDVAFTSTQTATPLYWELDQGCDSSSGRVVAWVKIPSAASSGTFWIQYGGSQSSFQSTAASVWNSNYLLVMHLGETGAGGAGDYKDSTGGHNSRNTTSQPTRATGKIGYGQGSFSANSVYVELANTINPTNLTFEGWANWSDVTGYQYWTGAGSDTTGFTMALYNDSKPMIFIGASWWRYSTTVSNGNWYHIMATLDDTGNTGQLCVNGTCESTSTTASWSTTSNYMSIGVRGGYYMKGTIDEVRVSDVARSSAWAAASYANQNSTTWLTKGSEQ